jgi:hypothetical protein
VRQNQLPPRRELTRRLLTPLAALTLAACGQAVPGSPTPNADAAHQAADRMFTQSIDALEKYVTASKNFRGTLFRYVTLKGKSTSGEVDVSQYGRPESLIAKFHATDHPDYRYDTFHPAGNDRDFILLGPGYASLAPTKWVSLPTTTSSGYVCATPGLQTLCKMSEAMEATSKATPAGLEKSAARLPDGGFEARTAITLKSFLDKTLISIPADITALIEPEMTGRLIPLRIQINSDSTLRKIEINGEVAGQGGKMQIQLGYEAKGPSEPGDFPSTPPPAEVTALPDRAAADEFQVKLGQVRAN